MALINDAKGLIITGGLGGPACCALITASFSLVCGCDFKIVVTGGGGYYPHHVVTPYYSPMRAPAQDTCLVLVDIKLRDHHWRKSYVVDKGKGDTIVTILAAFNKVKTRIVKTVTSFNHAIKRTWAYFNGSNK